MTIKIIINAIFIIALGILQISFISALPAWFGNLNIFLVILIFMLAFTSFNFAVWWSVGAAMMMEIFSFLPFGAYLISFCLTLAIANFLFNYFLTNRSLYSFLALVSLANFVYELIINLLLLIFSQGQEKIFLIGTDFWLLTMEKIVMNLLFTFFIYYLIHFLIRNLRPVFLIKK